MSTPPALPSTKTALEVETPKEVDTGSEPGLAVRQEAARRGHRTAYIKVLIPVLCVFVVISGLIVLLHLYAFGVYIGSAQIGTTTSAQYIVTISQVLSNVVDKANPVIASSIAFDLASDWLATTRRGARPLPEQYGSAIPSLKSGRLGSHIISRVKHAHWHHIPTLAIPLWLYVAVAIADFILHVTVQSASYRYTTHLPSATTAPYSRIINHQQCSAYPADSASGATCGLLQDDGSVSPGAFSSGLQVLTGSSPTSQVLWIDNWGIYDFAFLGPSYEGPNVAYTAHTYGVRAMCETISARCLSLNGQPPAASGVAPIFECTGSPRVNLDNTAIQSGNLPFGVLQPDGTVVTTNSYQAVMSNPFPLISVVSSLANVNISEDLGFQTYGNRAWNVLSCNVSTNVLSVTYKQVVYPNATHNFILGAMDHTTKDLGPAPLSVAVYTGATISSGLLGSLISRATDGVQLYQFSYVDYYTLQVQRHFAAFSSAAYTPADADKVARVVSVEGTTINLVLLEIYASLVVLYLVVVIFYGRRAFLGCYQVPWTDLGQQWLTSPVPLINNYFGPVNSEKTWKSDAEDCFGDESTADRLSVGPTLDSSGQLIFGVYRQDVGH